MENLLMTIFAPLASGFIGWFANAYRNKQKKESDQIEIAKQYKELLKEAIEDKKAMYQKIDDLREELSRVKEEVAKVKNERSVMQMAISRASECVMYKECPVFDHIKINAL